MHDDARMQDDPEWPAAIARLRGDLSSVFGVLIARAAWPDAELDRAPVGGGWTAREVLEHIVRTDHFLLRLADKLCETSIKRAARGLPWPAHPPRFEHLARLASREFPWAVPAHMLPTERSLGLELARRLGADLERALALLDRAPDGVGTLHRIRMSMVGDDDRLDLYQYLEIVRLHAQRHLAQIERGRVAGPG